MENSLKEKMLLMTTTEISDVFIKQYIYEYGEKKARDITVKIYSLKKVNYLIYKAMKDIRFFTFNELLSIYSGIPYFIFAKPETLCLGLFCAIIKYETMLSAPIDSLNSEIYLAVVNKYHSQHSELCLDIIKHYNRSSFFNRFFKNIESLPMPKDYSLDGISQEDYDDLLGDIEADINRGK